MLARLSRSGELTPVRAPGAAASLGMQARGAGAAATHRLGAAGRAIPAGGAQRQERYQRRGGDLRGCIQAEHALRAGQERRAAAHAVHAPAAPGLQGGAHGCINRIRGLLAEFGVVVAQSPKALREVLPDALEDANEMNGLARLASERAASDDPRQTVRCESPEHQTHLTIPARRVTKRR
jgi:hypothetical protein